MSACVPSAATATASTQVMKRTRLPETYQSAMAPRMQKREACPAAPSSRPIARALQTTARVAASGLE
jgi:hypothetical protein